jgi:hypothetical protein
MESTEMAPSETTPAKPTGKPPRPTEVRVPVTLRWRVDENGTPLKSAFVCTILGIDELSAKVRTLQYKRSRDRGEAGAEAKLENLAGVCVDVEEFPGFEVAAGESFRDAFLRYFRDEPELVHYGWELYTRALMPDELFR